MNREIRLRVAGHVIYPGGKEEFLLQSVRSTKGFGRWIYCKYCYKNVKPLLSGINQIVCSKCGAGLTPDFFAAENLKHWLGGDDRFKDDLHSNEARIWFEKHRLTNVASNEEMK